MLPIFRKTKLITSLEGGHDVVMDKKTGIVVVRDSNGTIIASAHPSSVDAVTEIDSPWGKGEKQVEAFGRRFNISRILCGNTLTAIARQYCRCKGYH